MRYFFLSVYSWFIFCIPFYIFTSDCFICILLSWYTICSAATNLYFCQLRILVLQILQCRIIWYHSGYLQLYLIFCPLLASFSVLPEKIPKSLPSLSTEKTLLSSLIKGTLWMFEVGTYCWLHLCPLSFLMVPNKRTKKKKNLMMTWQYCRVKAYISLKACILLKIIISV